MVKNLSSVKSSLYDDNNDRINMYYWEDDEEIRGFKKYDKSNYDDIIQSINKIKLSLKSGQKIGYVYSNENESLHNKLIEQFGDLIDAKPIHKSQGLENDYYIVDISNDESGNYDILYNKKEFYTGFSRAKKGGIIIKNDYTILTINNVKEDSSDIHIINE
jgi:hypothetical protein